jgi:cellulose synthase/poly-beta-1,6-N-acetylglucosamine synthase-like glycosyltransferase/peptidoglycan/xylan/chitin deacetylase (PgdA/CDA1 family)/spore germination protein YaaH
MRFFLLAILLIVAAAGVFAFTLVNVPVPADLLHDTERPRARPFLEQLFHTRHATERKLAALGSAWLPPATGRAANAVNPVRMAFYAPWDDSSRASLRHHIGQIDWLASATLYVFGPRHDLNVVRDAPLHKILGSASRRPKLMPVLQNARDGEWDGKGTAAMLASRTARAALLDKLDRALVAEKADGVVFDLEQLPPGSLANYRTFIGEARARFAPRHWAVSVSVPVDSGWNLRAFAQVADRLILMDYDEHSNDGEPGPIASQSWFVNRLGAAMEQVPASQMIVAIGNYGYDWSAPGHGEPVADEDAWQAAEDSSATPVFDRQSGNAGFAYEERGVTHTVWMLDAASAWNEMRAAARHGVAGIALWRLGTEDPGYWAAQDNYRKGTVPDLRSITSIGSVDVEGDGEILTIASQPQPGHRRIFRNAQDLIVDERFDQLPTNYTVDRTGNRPGLVALTFDDGPDPEWTPRILDILKQKHVPGTFFVIGENAMAHPLLIQRLVNEGHEIGNHSFTHPNLAWLNEAETRLELNATQRVVEAYTGHALRLFRAPYFGDAEPTTTDELVPASTAQEDGYTNVGLHVDPGDWKRPGVNRIIESTIDQVTDPAPDRSAQIVLLHDAGGDRAQTVEALPHIIDDLRARGYRFVPVSALAGLSHSAVMPPVKGADLLAVRADVGMFLILAALSFALRWLFFAAIVLGVGRAVVLAGLALFSARKSQMPVPPPIDPDLFVSVLIPCFNEAAVIESSVKRVLSSRDTRIEVIVIDDGSSDGTSVVVKGAFGDDPRVRLLTLPNGGKAHALNRGLALAQGEIIVALDADTQFEPETIARLARWFADPAIGAVAGNAKVGNRVNLVTRWQAVEYVTAQNLERRALNRFDAVMVVPGAVGAWRRRALDDVGGYPVDTLAEDQDLTIAIQRKGWAVTYDIDAVAWTEAPESFGALAKQRFRWAYGTLQCLWKHRSVLGVRQPGGLAFVGMPQAWVFQVGFALISPLIDLALVVSMVTTAINVHQHGWAQTQSDLLRMAIYWIAFLAIDLTCGWIAYRLEPRERRFPAFLLIAQRVVYRQIMYSVVVRAVANALRGPWVGWGKLERSGRVDAGMAG